MNITEVIKKKGLPYEMEGDIMVQIGEYDLGNKGITTLDNFKQNGRIVLSYNQINSLKGFKQNGYADLSHNRITSLDGFEQNGVLYLNDNQITSLEGFKQNGFLDLDYNKIMSLEGFKQNGPLFLKYNQITSLEGFEKDGNRFDLIGNPIAEEPEPSTELNPKLKDIIKQEANKILHIAIECEDLYEGQEKIEERLNDIINDLINALTPQPRSFGNENDTITGRVISSIPFTAGEMTLVSPPSTNTTDKYPPQTNISNT